jgi:hypothetical protein
MYKPTPINTDHIKLPEDILQLAELLAKNAHDIWAVQRMAEGWTYGEKRDDNLKQHPCLIPYEDLPESEKEYDRLMSIETLKVILGLGYKIQKSGDRSQE